MSWRKNPLADDSRQDTGSSTIRVRSRRPTRNTETGTLPGPAHLVVLVGPDAGRRIAVADELELGRDVPGEGLLSDDGVSRHHVRFMRTTDDGFRVVDLESRNGTFVNGARVRERVLQSGDKIAVGARTILLFTRYDRYEAHILQQQKMQALGQLAGGIAHDFNNLLAAVLGNVSYLASRGEPSRQDVDECLAEIEIAARRAAELTRHLLDYARERELSLCPVDISRLIDEATLLLRRALPRRVEVETKVEPGLWVMGDAALLLQVVMNAGINSGQAMPDGGRLEIRIDRHTVDKRSDTGHAELSPGRYVRIRISDTGVGMDEATLQRVFHPFFSTKPQGQGTGMGMANAQGVVREHGGDIDIDSELGSGARVTVYLPEAEPSKPGTVPVDDVLGPLSGTVLLADDEPLVCATATRILRGLGLEVHVASDGRAVATLLDELLAQGTTADLAILGDELRLVTTERLLPIIRARAPRMRVLVSSGKLDAEQRAALEELGAHGFLGKPYDARTLRTAIAGQLAGQLVARGPGGERRR
jgi:two-component system cell cycle sensor histidine kinase/response regulator CckA